jgi:predicted ribosomally synthesized peptide with nif11-like leader
MSLESATRFLIAIAQDESMREKFAQVRSAEEFLSVSDQLGYHFTTSQLKQVIAQESQNVILRRQTGIWRWLRNVEWM